MKKHVILALLVVLFGFAGLVYAFSTANGPDMVEDGNKVTAGGEIASGEKTGIIDEINSNGIETRDGNNACDEILSEESGDRDEINTGDGIDTFTEPKEPYEAAKAWAEGVKTRDGKLQYAVMSEDLKKEYYSSFEGLGWVTGVSSPWVKDYKITETYSDNSTYRYEAVFTYTDSTNTQFTATEHVTVENFEGAWLISAIEEADTEDGFSE